MFDETKHVMLQGSATMLLSHLPQLLESRNVRLLPTHTVEDATSLVSCIVSDALVRDMPNVHHPANASSVRHRCAAVTDALAIATECHPISCNQPA